MIPRKFLAVLLLSVFAIIPATHASFLDPLWSARVAGLGGAFSAVPDDPDNLFYNSASCVNLERPAARLTYADLFTSFEQTSLTLNQGVYAHPIRPGRVVGVGWSGFRTGGLYREDTFLLTYVHRIDRIFQETVPPFGVSVSMKYLSRQFYLDSRSVNDPVFREGRRTDALAYDVSFFTERTLSNVGKLSMALAVKSLNEPDLGFQEREPIPREIIVGGRYTWRRVAFSGDINHRAQETLPHLGVEGGLFGDRLLLRVGTDTLQAGMGFGYRHPLSKSFSILFDYAALCPLEIKGNTISHRVTLGVTF
jgi:hypothetical protein